MNMQKINRFWQSANLFLAPVLLTVLSADVGNDGVYVERLDGG